MLPNIRLATSADSPALWEMLTYAAHVEGDLPDAIAEAQRLPFLRKYVEDWGRVGDVGVLASDAGGAAVGAAWVRLLEHSYYSRDYAAQNIPELAIGVRPEWRGQGVGAALMERLIGEAKGEFPGIVLSVRHSNPAVRFYERLGFIAVEEIANRVGTPSWVMLLPLGEDTQ